MYTGFPQYPFHHEVEEIARQGVALSETSNGIKSLTCAHAPTEEKDDVTKDTVYAELDRAYGRCLFHDIKILLGDFNAKVGREDIFGAAVGRFSHKASWLSPDRLTRNKIDHIVIDARHESSVLDVRSCRGPNIDSDHYLVAAKTRTRLCVKNVARRGLLRRLDIGKLQSQQPRDAFSTKVFSLLSRTTPTPEDISDQWALICHSLRTSAEEVIGFQRPPTRNPWYDQECRDATAAKGAVVEVYRIRRRDEKRLFRRKKREQEKRECESIESSRCRNEARNFYQRVKRLTQGCKTGGVACKDNDGNLVTDAEIVLKLWRDHFSSLLTGSGTGYEDYDPQAPIYGTDIDVATPSHAEVNDAIQRLKNNKSAGADGLPAELFKAAGDMLVGSMHQLISKIWRTETMPEDWNLSMICPVLKKGDATLRTNYRGISLLPVAYKIFTLCQILEKFFGNHIDTDYKAAFDSPRRDRLYAAMSEFGIPAKLIRLCRMTLSNTISSVKAGVHRTGTILTNRCVQLLGYANDIDITDRTKRDVTAAFGTIKKESAKVGLAVNMDKTKFMVCSSRELRRLDSQLTADSYSFESVKEFMYFGTVITSTNDVSLEIKRRVR
ncbi:uncharacterized protein LOC122319800 [Drosophila ficusphila]|uniref:uncharacterized protein LOC122319800 n=1 Tax=Drosophila ficusphila TaxID=30025 RepID=UPI001C8A979E|nr:uncharacterized protein LOC122319800 [Drosophila ficusphila]